MSAQHGHPGDERIGELLVRTGVISDVDLQAALTVQAREGGRLGRLLLLSGAVTRRDLYQALAQQWQLPFLDLCEQPPQDTLLAEQDADTILARGWVAHHVTADGRVAVATAVAPSPSLRAELTAAYGAHGWQLHATTDWDLDRAVLTGYRDQLAADAADGFAEARPELSAAAGVSRWQKWSFACGAGGLITAALLWPLPTLTVAVMAVNVLFAASIVFKAAASVLGALRVRRLELTQLRAAARRLDAGLPVRERIADADLPMYTILVPAFHEANIISKLLDNMRGLDYPKSKLQVLLLLEEDDVATIAAAKAARPPEYVRIIVIPRGRPQTKPRACNVGLAFATGEYLVIYDAEDRPEPGQLRDALAAFRDADAARGPHDPETVCIQARLNYFNASENVLTRLFALEYSMWFDVMLPGLDAMSLPIPLGGTSNHFRTDALRRLGAWDPWNVTEDADLGVRATAVGARVGVIDSTTWEEACSQWRPWIRQRTRWIKGYMVTALVHTRNPVRMVRTIGWRGAAGLLGLVAGTPLSFLACPLVWALTVFTYAGGQISGIRFAPWVVTVTGANAVLGNGLMIAVSMLAAVRRRSLRLAGFALLNPVYWMLHSIAAWRALYQMVRSPFHWEKTPHGLSNALPEVSPVT